MYVEYKKDIEKKIPLKEKLKEKKLVISEREIFQEERKKGKKEIMFVN